jgi:hypothetical protein
MTLFLRHFYFPRPCLELSTKLQLYHRDADAEERFQFNGGQLQPIFRICNAGLVENLQTARSSPRPAISHCHYHKPWAQIWIISFNGCLEHSQLNLHCKYQRQPPLLNRSCSPGSNSTTVVCGAERAEDMGMVAETSSDGRRERVIFGT